jgi:hypothetical protein
MQVSTLLKSGALTLSQLQAAPYYLKIRQQSGLIVLNYDQINSPESNNIVRECRGLILDETFTPVSVGFHRFPNFNEKIHKIDWHQFRAYEKLDGSIISLYHHANKWQFATRSNPVADGFIAQSNTTFTALLETATSNTALVDLNNLDLDSNVTYIFEIVSPLNTIVTKYLNTELVLLSARNKITGQELSFDNLDRIATQLQVKRPAFKVFNSLLEAQVALRSHPITFEGFVLTKEETSSVTGHTRYKLKSPAYVALHHLKGEITPKNLLQVLVRGEKEELLSAFPQEAVQINKLAVKLDTFKQQFNSAYSLAQTTLAAELLKNPSLSVEAQKQIFAKALSDFPNKNLAFACFIQKCTIDDLLQASDPAKLLKQL